jgi:hypothetical protein
MKAPPVVCADTGILCAYRVSWEGGVNFPGIRSYELRGGVLRLLKERGETHMVTPQDALMELARETLGLVVLAPVGDELALLPVLHAGLGPGLAALDELDLAELPAEPDLDPGRAPAGPVA